jgi:uncharacterized membrane protein YqjE
MGDTTESRRFEGLGGSLRRFGDSLMGLLETRVEILSLEWAEERRTLSRVLLVVFALAVCLQLAIVMGLVFLMLAINEEQRLAVLGIATLALLLAVVIGGLWLRRWLKSRPPMFAVTMTEIRKDREWIRGKP